LREPDELVRRLREDLTGRRRAVALQLALSELVGRRGE